MSDGHQILNGIGVYAGTSHGRVVFVMPAPEADPDEGPCTDWEAGSARIREAMQAVAEDLRNRRDLATDEKSKAVLAATAQLAADKGLIKSVDKKLKKGEGPTHAVYSAVEDYAVLLKKLGGYMAERVTDLHDVRDRTIARLRGLPAPGVPDITEPVIIAAYDLAPAEAATLDPKLVMGILTEEGGPTSHTAILAAQLGIPCVVKISGLTRHVHDGGTVALDGGVGEVVVSPTETEIAELEERSRRRAAALAGSSGEGATRDGHHVALYANIGKEEDAERAAAFDLEGSGLFRT
ncbi:MAG: phosphoenolpyruvate--protein phosphotransferase, partial [Scardovia wiggsiae]|nr:phosphoenolpyruvate--protein phosphotransferase [Scardovia wiggsiae]